MTGELKVWGRFSSPWIQVLLYVYATALPVSCLGLGKAVFHCPFGCFALVEKEKESFYRKIAASVPNDG